jgi:DNA helicase-2/ATP-dependent DNA helicase PcrA
MAYQKKKWSKAPVVKTPRVQKNWSSFQLAIFDEIASGTGNLHVEAKAGSGKTSTIVESFYRIPRGKTALMCAFAKPIQIELEKKAPDGVTVKTLHSVGLAACRKYLPKLLPGMAGIDNKGEKVFGYIKAERGDDKETLDVRMSLAQAVSLAKGYLAETYEEIDSIMDRHDVDIFLDTREAFITTVLKVMKATREDTTRVDFDDMIWLPNVLGMKLDQYDFVFIDEAQDLNTAQIYLALGSCKPTGRVMSVGDTRQAIYAFRGADSEAINNIITRMDSKVLPLSVTYRCARQVVELAQTIVPELEAAPDAIEGMVESIPDNNLENLVAPGDFILSRTNAPLIGWCLALIRARVPANIKGRDLGKNLLGLIKASKATDVDSFLAWLEEWKNTEVERLTKLKRDVSIPQDKAECLNLLCEGTKSLEVVKSNIDKLFYEGDDDKDRVILSTTHKAKGLERDRVFMLSHTYHPGKSVEEDNLYYVAVTRARKELYLVSNK